MLNLSPLQKSRLKYKPKTPEILDDLDNVGFEEVSSKGKPDESLKELFPNTFNTPAFQLKKGKGKRGKVKIGVMFSGGPAPGGHNVIAGLFDSGASVLGFLNGASGVIEKKYKIIEDLDLFRNQGGFHLIGTGRTKIDTPEQFKASMNTCQELSLDGLVIIGGDDSNTNAVRLAEYFLEMGCATKVIGVPKTIDADLRSDEIEISFGFDSATKTYAELIGNLGHDALSTKKYYHFIKLMGRSASHIALECALKVRPNLCLISEERLPLQQIIDDIANLITEREKAGKNYGIILIPEGLIEFIPELNEFVKDLDIPKDSHGNIEVSKIETEKFILDLVKKELKKRNFEGKFNALCHSFGYEGRSCLPSNFDANYCYSLGKLASICIREGLTGVICAIQNLKLDPRKWVLKAVPILPMVHFEMRLGERKAVIQKVLVDTNKVPYINYLSSRSSWRMDDEYQCPGPIQYFGSDEITESVPLTLE